MRQLRLPRTYAILQLIEEVLTRRSLTAQYTTLLSRKPSTTRKPSKELRKISQKG